MIDKLYKLKQQQINLEVSKKQQVLSKLNDIDNEVRELSYHINTTTVDVMGSISDFRVLEIHKNTMKENILRLLHSKENLYEKIKIYDSSIIILNKESEQFKYIPEEEKKEKLKEITKQEELIASEYMQAKYVQERLGLNNGI